MKILNFTQGRTNMTSLQGYLETDYNTLVEVFGEPTYVDSSADEKVNTEWELQFEIEDEHDVKTVYATIYDWKDYDGGFRSRSGTPYRWHIGGFNWEAVEAVQQCVKFPEIAEINPA